MKSSRELFNEKYLNNLEYNDNILGVDNYRNNINKSFLVLRDMKINLKPNSVGFISIENIFSYIDYLENRINYLESQVNTNNIVNKLINKCKNKGDE